MSTIQYNNTIQYNTYVCLYRELPSIPEVSLTGVPVVKRVIV